ncbi:hypothetical protein ACP4OV_026442 [Aristida adscensionis]
MEPSSKRKSPGEHALPDAVVARIAERLRARGDIGRMTMANQRWARGILAAAAGTSSGEPALPTSTTSEEATERRPLIAIAAGASGGSASNVAAAVGYVIGGSASDVATGVGVTIGGSVSDVAARGGDVGGGSASNNLVAATATASSPSAMLPSYPNSIMEMGAHGLEPSSECRNRWNRLPVPVLVRIVEHGLSLKDIGRVMVICKHWGNTIVAAARAASRDSATSSDSALVLSDISVTPNGWLWLAEAGSGSILKKWAVQLSANAATASSGWGAIPNDVLWKIVNTINLKDVAAMRLASVTWRDTFPGPPFCIISHIPTGTPTVWAINSKGSFVQIPYMQNLPQTSYAGERLPVLPGQLKPEGLFIFQNRRLLRFLIVVGDSRAFALQAGAFQELDEEGGHSIRSVHFKVPWLFTVDLNCEVKASVENMTIQQPEVPELSEGKSPLIKNGHHLFECNGQLYLCIVLECGEVKTVKLYRAVEQRDEYGDMVIVSFIPDEDIGPFSVYFRPNQALVCPSNDTLIGRKRNTHILKISMVSVEDRVLSA